MCYDARDDFWVEKAIQKIRGFDSRVFREYQKLCKDFRVAFLHQPTSIVKELCDDLAAAAEAILLSHKSYKEFKAEHPNIVEELFALFQEMEDEYFDEFYVFDQFIEDNSHSTKPYKAMGYSVIGDLSAVSELFYYFKEWMGTEELFERESKRVKDLVEVFEESGKDLDALKSFDYGLDDWDDRKEHDLGVRDFLPENVIGRRS